MCRMSRSMGRIVNDSNLERGRFIMNRTISSLVVVSLAAALSGCALTGTSSSCMHGMPDRSSPEATVVSFTKAAARFFSPVHLSRRAVRRRV